MQILFLFCQKSAVPSPLNFPGILKIELKHYMINLVRSGFVIDLVSNLKFKPLKSFKIGLTQTKNKKKGNVLLGTVDKALNNAFQP